MKAHPPLKRGGLRVLLLLIPLSGVFSQDTAKLIPNPRILYSSTMRHADGGTTTYQRIEPPTAEQLAAIQPAQQVPSALAAPLPPVLQFTARVYDGALTELKWSHNGVECRAWSSVDFRLLEAIPQFEQNGITRRLSGIAMTQRQPPAGVVTQRPWPQFPAEVLAAVPAGMRSWYVLMEYNGPSELEASVCAAMDSLHAYVEANWEALHARRIQREAQKATEAAYKAAHPEPPPVPTNTIIQLWKTPPSEIQTPSQGGQP